jgi:hypothetical protein
VLRREAFSFGRVEAEATPRACACSGQLEGPYRVKRAFPLVKTGLTWRSGRAFTPAESWPHAASSGLFLRLNQDRRNAPGVRLLRPNRGLAPRQVVFSFGQIRTDATLQACACSGRIVASRRVKRAFSSVKSGPTQCSRRAFAPAESWPRVASSGLFLPSNQDRRNAPGVRLLRPNRGLAPRQAGFFFGQIRTDATLQVCACSG